MPKEAATVTAIAPTSEPIPVKRLKPLPVPAFKLIETVNQTWRVTVPASTPRERLCESDLHALMGDRFHAFDRVLAIADDSSWFAELLVVSCGVGHAAMIELLYKPLPKLVVPDDALPPNHEVFHAGVDTMWCVKRISDGVLLGTGFTSRQAAVQYLLDHASLK